MQPIRAFLLLLCLTAASPLPLLAHQIPAQDSAPVQDSDLSASNLCDVDTVHSIPDDKPLDFSTEKRLVIDQPGVLSPDCATQLKHEITLLEQSTGAQLRVLIVNSMNGEDIESFANETFHAWRLGRAGIDDGALIVIAQKERRSRIEVGYGLEGAIPDAVTGEILRNDLHPQLSLGAYGQGLQITVNDLSQRIRSAGIAPPKPKPAPKSHEFLWFFFTEVCGLIAMAIATHLGWKWIWRLSLPVALAVVLTLAGAPFHLSEGARALPGIIPVTMTFSLIGYPIGRNPGESIRLLGRMAVMFVIFSILVLVVISARPEMQQHVAALFVVDCMCSGFFGFLWYFLAGAKFGGAPDRLGLSQWHDEEERSRSSSSIVSSDSSSSSSSGDWASSSSSDSSFSDSGGGGGDSGGGGSSDSF